MFKTRLRYNMTSIIIPQPFLADIGQRQARAKDHLSTNEILVVAMALTVVAQSRNLAIIGMIAYRVEGKIYTEEFHDEMKLRVDIPKPPFCGSVMHSEKYILRSKLDGVDLKASYRDVYDRAAEKAVQLFLKTLLTLPSK